MTRRPYLLIPVLAALPFLFYAVTGYGGHDFRFHATAWLELHQAWRAHEFLLGWSSLSQYGHGDPRFTFYPPLSLLLGAALTFLLPFRLVPAAVPWLILTTSGLAMYFGAARLLPPQHRLQAALVYMFNPYLLLTLIARYAVAEAWVQALFPITFFFFFRAATGRRRQDVAALTLLLATGWLTNIPAAIVLAYSLTLLAFALSLYQRSPYPALRVVIAQLGGLLLAACRLLPAYTERRLVAPKALLGYDFRDQMPTLHQHHILVLVCAVFMCVAAAISLLSARQALATTARPRTLVLTLLTLGAISVVFELPLSDVLWSHLPELKYVQFPFRFLFLISLASTLLLFYPPQASRLRPAALALSAVLALLPFLAFARLLPLNRVPSIKQAEIAWSQGFEGTPEYLPATPSALSISNLPSCEATSLRTTPNQRLLSTRSVTPCDLTLPTFYYFFWSATLDASSGLPLAPDRSGFLETRIPPGFHRINLRFNPTSSTRTLANLISLATLLLVAPLCWPNRKTLPPHLTWKRPKALRERHESERRSTR